MGRKNKRYKKDLHQQAYDRLVSMQAFGESKYLAKQTGETAEKIYSFETYRTYWKHTKYFTKWMKQKHPECTTLKKARQYVPDWLRERQEQGLSSWTLHTEAAALNKLFAIHADDPARFQPPKRERKHIKRSRVKVPDDKHFSVTNNAELIDFCRGTGLRRSGVLSIKGKDLISEQEIKDEMLRISAIPAESRTAYDRKLMKLCEDTRFFEKVSCGYYVHVKEKGGRERLAPIIGPDADNIVARFKRTRPDEHVWQHVSSHADIHSYRAEYATYIYRETARKIKDIPYDRINKGSGKRYQSEVYACRKDEAGRKLDKRAMLICSKALGHNRIDVVANNYLRGL